MAFGSGQLFAKKAFSGSSLFAGVKDLIAGTASHALDSTAPLPELSSVVAVREIHEGDKTVPCGARGAIVFVHDGGVGYEVEFVEPVHLVVSASRDELAPA